MDHLKTKLEEFCEKLRKCLAKKACRTMFLPNKGKVGKAKAVNTDTDGVMCNVEELDLKGHKGKVAMELWLDRWTGHEWWNLWCGVHASNYGLESVLRERVVPTFTREGVTPKEPYRLRRRLPDGLFYTPILEKLDNCGSFFGWYSRGCNCDSPDAREVARRMNNMLLSYLFPSGRKPGKVDRGRRKP